MQILVFRRSFFYKKYCFVLYIQAQTRHWRLFKSQHDINSKFILFFQNKKKSEFFSILKEIRSWRNFPDNTFWGFATFQHSSLHHKWNGTRLLSPETKCISCITSSKRLQTYDLSKWQNFKRTSKLDADIVQYLFSLSEIKVLIVEQTQLLNFP